MDFESRDCTDHTESWISWIWVGAVYLVNAGSPSARQEVLPFVKFIISMLNIKRIRSGHIWIHTGSAWGSCGCPPSDSCNQGVASALEILIKGTLEIPIMGPGLGPINLRVLEI